MIRSFSCALIAALALASCAPKLQTHIDFQPDVAFASLGSFAVEPQASSAGVTDAQRANRAFAAQAVERQLVAKGLRVAPAAQADLLVRPSIGTRAKVRVSGASSSGTYGGLVVDIVDRRSGRTVWHGVAYETVTGSMDVQAEIEKAAAKLLADFPPSA
jgi:uncharacterized lipoprotein YajG